MNPVPSNASPAVLAWLWNGDEPRVSPVFQPIVDLLSGEAIGYEVLSRGQGAVQAPAHLFTRARREGVSWELERACWTAAVRRIATLPAEDRRVPFFFNVSPDVLSDPRFSDGSTLELLERHGLQPGQVVIEITETATFENTGRLEELTRAHSEHGFGIALDDFGAGHSGLVTLVHSAPDFIKLDQALVRDIHLHGYRQHLVRSLVAFAASVDAVLIAEGVETWDELLVLMRLGVRHAQGFLVARPAVTPPRPSGEFEQRRHAALRALRLCGADGEETAGSLVIRRACAQDTLSAAELDLLFRDAPELDHVVLLRQERPQGLVTRQGFYARAAGAPGPLVPTRALVVKETLSLTALARLAMARPPECLYEPIIVQDAEGSFLGTVTVKQLLQRAFERRALP